MEAFNKFKAHKRRAEKRNIPFTLTFEEWYDIWQKSNHWEQRGRGRDKYVMSRIGDKGGYTLGNVFIQSNLNNVIEGNKNRVISEETKLKHKLNKQKSITPEHIKKMHAARYGHKIQELTNG